MRPFTIVVSLLALTIAGAPVAQAASTTPPATTTPQFGTSASPADGMDRAVKPGDDFWGYANGTWDKKTAIPADKSIFGGFAVLDDLSRERTRAIIEDAAKAGPAGDADARRVGDLLRDVHGRGGDRGEGDRRRSSPRSTASPRSSRPPTSRARWRRR